MPKLVMTWGNHANWSSPKRGDVLCFPKTRYWVLRVRKIKTRDRSAKYECWCEQEQFIEEELRFKLLRTAGRARPGYGQIQHPCFWHPRKPKAQPVGERPKSSTIDF